MVILLSIIFFFYVPQVHAAVPTVAAVLIKTTNSSQFTPPSPDTSGITYIPGSGRLLLADSEVDEMPIFSNVNLYEITTSGTVLQTGSTTRISPSSHEPTGVAYNSTNGHLYVSDDDYKRIFTLTEGADGIFGTPDDTVTYFSTSAFGATDPEGVTVGLGNLFIADGINHKVFRVTTTGSLLSSIDTSAYGQQDLEGITYNPDTGTLFILSLNPKLITEVTVDGTLLRKIDISAAHAVAPADLVFAPSSSASDNPNLKSLYVVDRGIDNNTNPAENDGKMYELSVPGLVVPSPSPIDGDLNGDGHVDLFDYNLLVTYFGTPYTIYDYNALVTNFGT